MRLAFAGVGGAAGPTWPVTLVVGGAVSAYIDIVNASDGVNASENVEVVQITFTPSCAAQTVGACTTPDPGVFTLGATGDRGRVRTQHRESGEPLLEPREPRVTGSRDDRPQA